MASLRHWRHAAVYCAARRIEQPFSSKQKRDILEPARHGSGGDAVEFAHNTLKAWLASFYYLDEGAPRALASQALASDYAQIIPFAVAAPGHRQYAELLIDHLLDSAEKTSNPQHRRALLILAARCDAAAPNLPRTLRKRLVSIPELLFPPVGFDECQQLAVLGDTAVPQLAPRVEMSEEQAAASVRCLRLIGTERAREAAEAWRDRREPRIVEELADVFHPLTLTAILDGAQDLEQWQKLPPSVKGKIADLTPLQEQTHLTRLFLLDTPTADLNPLAQLTRLEWLGLSGTQVEDIAPLASLSALQWLDLSETHVADAVALASLTNLRWLNLCETRVSAEAVAKLKRAFAERGNRSVKIIGP